MALKSSAAFLFCVAFAATGAEDCYVTGSGPSSEQDRLVGDFTSVQVSSDILANITIGSTTSVSISGYGNILDRVTADVDGEGKLHLGLKPRTCNSDVTARITVPKPLAYVGASRGGRVIVDKVAGSMWAGFSSFINASELAPEWPMSVTASSSSGIIVFWGSVDYMSVTASDKSNIDLGEVTANNAVISSSTQSTVTGMTSKKVTVTVTDGSAVSVRVTENTAYTCVGGSKLTVAGGASMTRYWSQDCTLETPP